MSRIYQDGALRSKAVLSARLPGAWDPAAHQGYGVWVIGGPWIPQLTRGRERGDPGCPNPGCQRLGVR
jgi:hypothetical protein